MSPSVSDKAAATENAERYEFKSEARQLLELMIHSVYSNKEVFLRELISNSSDALDRRRVEAITNKALLEEGTELEIRVWADKDKRTLTIEDDGIGMDRDEIIANLGTIARSGTKEFMAKLAGDKGGDGDQQALIGQFGVGFYSAFMVADEVSVVTRRAGTDVALKWVSKGDGHFTIEDGERDTAGTTVTLHLREADPDNGLVDFAENWVIKETIKKHSDFVRHKIKLKTIETKDEEETVTWPTVNSMKAIWTRPASDVKDEEYTDFYKHVSRDWNDPLERISLKAEGTFEYHALLFVPTTPPFDLYWRDMKFGLQLYVNQVLIKDRCEDLLPGYLRFVKGVVDSPDLSLNVSREMLQQDRRVGQIRKRIIKKTLDALKAIQKDDAGKYSKFWDGFGRVIKEGILQDRENIEAIQPLLMFQSSHDADKLTTLDDYVERMKDEQDVIYFVTGESRAAVEKSPHLEALFERGYEVLYLVEPVDELVVENMRTYKEKDLKSVGKGEVELGSEEERKEAEEKRKEAEEIHKTLLESLQDYLQDEVKEVRLSSRLTTSAVCLVGSEQDMSPQLERLLEQAGQTAPKQKRILEINPKHPLLDKLNSLHIANDTVKLADYAKLLYGQALLAEGSPLPDPVAFNKLVATVMIEAKG